MILTLRWPKQMVLFQANCIGSLPRISTAIKDTVPQTDILEMGLIVQT